MSSSKVSHGQLTDNSCQTEQLICIKGALALSDHAFDCSRQCWWDVHCDKAFAQLHEKMDPMQRKQKIDNVFVAVSTRSTENSN